MNKVTELDNALDYINNLVDKTYSQMYEAAKEMSKEQLLELLAITLTAQKSKESQLLKELAKTENISLAVNYANITYTYIKEIDGNIDKIMSQPMQATTNTENALPADMIR